MHILAHVSLSSTYSIWLIGSYLHVSLELAMMDENGLYPDHNENGASETRHGLGWGMAEIPFARFSTSMLMFDEDGELFRRSGCCVRSHSRSSRWMRERGVACMLCVWGKDPNPDRAIVFLHQVGRGNSGGLYAFDRRLPRFFKSLPYLPFRLHRRNAHPIGRFLGVPQLWSRS